MRRGCLVREPIVIHFIVPTHSSCLFFVIAISGRSLVFPLVRVFLLVFVFEEPVIKPHADNKGLESCL